MKIASHNRHPRTGFTLIEVIVVVAILVLLIAVLVPVISKSRNAARAGATLAQMQHIAQACEHYYSDFGAYPGPVDDTALDGTVKFTGAQNLCLGLTRRFYPIATPSINGQPVTPAPAQPDSTLPIWFDTNPGKQLANYAINNPFGPLTVSISSTINSNNFDAYLTPKPQELSGAQQSNQANGLDLVDFPCFVDYAFGDAARPILYYRQAYKYDLENAAALTTTGGVNTTPFATSIVLDKYAVGQQAAYYSNTNTLIDKDGTVATKTSTPPLDTFVTNSINGNPVPKGGFILISAGIDRVYGTSDDIVVAGGH